MSKNVLRGLSVVLGALFLYGCAATENVEVRRYVEVKDRIDQNMEQGNAGFIMGTPQPEDRSGIRKTRKTYVVEVSKGIPEDTEEVIIENDDAVMQESNSEKSDYEEEDMGYSSETVIETKDKMAVSYQEDKVVQDVKPAASFVEYTVQKDDTMQKISKKFYDSYSKWPKIYEVNKDVISDPDKIKPGIVIRIPKL